MSLFYDFGYCVWLDSVGLHGVSFVDLLIVFVSLVVAWLIVWLFGGGCGFV